MLKKDYFIPHQININEEWPKYLSSLLLTFRYDDYERLITLEKGKHLFFFIILAVNYSDYYFMNF